MDNHSECSNIERIAQAICSREPLPAMNFTDLAEGYQAQQQVTGQINGQDQADLKAGVTALAAQQQFGLKAPLIGSLYRSGKLQSGCELTLVDGQELECEIGVMVDGEGHPVGLLPIVEVVYLAFSRQQDFSVANAVAANLGADRYICGEVIPWNVDLKEIDIRVVKDGLELVKFRNDYSFGTPADGANWLIQEAKDKGLWQSGSKGALLSLGTCGAPLKGEKGDYQVSFGALGEIRFKVL